MSDHDTPPGSDGARSTDDVDSLRTRWNEESPAAEVVRAVAVATGRDPTTMPPLQETVDPDALNALLASTNDDDGHLRIDFEYDGVTVTVDDGGEVAVRPTDE